MFHCNKFSTKDRGFDRGLSFGDPINQGHIDKDQDASARASSELVTGMVTVTHHPDFNFFATRRGHIVRDGFMNITIEFRPIMSWEAGFINNGIGRVKN